VLSFLDSFSNEHPGQGQYFHLQSTLSGGMDLTVPSPNYCIFNYMKAAGFRIKTNGYPLSISVSYTTAGLYLIAKIRGYMPDAQ